MGIDGFWIGYEGRRSNYAKQRGRPIDEVLSEFRDHGIIVLASMIVGFDYQNKEVVAQELDELMRLKPSLGQYLIYGPVPGTPFYERIIKENLLQDVYTNDRDLYYRSADGFRTMIKHPSLSAAEIEAIQEWCFSEDFQRLGPSIFRVLETRFLGHQRLKTSHNPVLRSKSDGHAAELRNAYPVFLAGRLLGPNATVRRWIGNLERQIHEELGYPTPGQRCKSVLAVAAALWTGLTLKLNLFQHPKLTRTSYRMLGKRWSAFEMWEGLCRKSASQQFSIRVDLQHAKQQVWMRLEGALSSTDAESVARRIHQSLGQCKNRLVLDFQSLRWDEATDLKPLREKLANFRSRIRVVLPNLAAGHPELILLERMFQQYQC